jgi:hypothetical protein
MKRKVIALAATVLAAGVAGALALVPSSQSTHAALQAAAVEPKELPAPPPPASSGKPVLEGRHAPVPILLKPRPTIDVLPVDAASQAEPPKAAEATSGAAAKAAVEADGYKGVRVVRKGDNGLWYAEGLRGSTKVMLIVDAQGNVTTE